MNTNAPAAVLWDMDGTIVDTEPLWVDAEAQLLNEWGISINGIDLDRWIGIGLEDLAYEFQGLGVHLGIGEIVTGLTQRVRALMATRGPVWRPGARELLASLVTAGIPNALVTMSLRAHAEEIVALLPPGTFTHVLGGDDVARPKPYPDPYLSAAAALDVRPAQCVALEDSITGCTSAHAAGAFTVGVTNLIDLSSAPAHTILPSLRGVNSNSLSQLFRAHELRMGAQSAAKEQST